MQCSVSAKLTTIDYAREHGLKAKSMCSATKALAESSARPPVPDSLFQKVQVVASHTPTASQWQVRLPNGTTVSFDRPIDAARSSLVLNAAAGAAGVTINSTIIALADQGCLSGQCHPHPAQETLTTVRPVYFVVG